MAIFQTVSSKKKKEVQGTDRVLTIIKDDGFVKRKVTKFELSEEASKARDIRKSRGE